MLTDPFFWVLVLGASTLALAGYIVGWWMAQKTCDERVRDVYRRLSHG